MSFTKAFLAAVSLAALTFTAFAAGAQGAWETQARLCIDRSSDKALESCEAAVATMPDDLAPRAQANIYFNLGTVLGELGRPEEGLYYLEKAAELDPLNGKTHYNMGVAYDDTARPNKAFHEYRKAVKLDPTLAEAWGNRGVSAHAKRKYLEAACSFENAMQLDPAYMDSRPDQQKMYEGSREIRPLTVAFGREVNVRVAPQVGYLITTGDNFNVDKFLYLMLDTGVDVQIYKRWFGTASFLYAHTKWKGSFDGGGINIYAPNFGIKYVSLEEDYKYPGDTLFDRSRYWFSLSVGPYITDLSRSVATDDGRFSASANVNLGANFATGFDYYFHPNVGIGIDLKLHFVNFAESYLIFAVGPHLIGRF